jgi:probable F420-dependent oxidoreductase
MRRVSVRIGAGIAGGFPFSGTEAFWRWVDLCEAGGLDSVWLSERLVSSGPMLEPVTTLAAIAGRTSRLKFGMYVTVLPLRDPLVLAKELATLDFLSDGRLLPAFGVGADTSPEWQALGVNAGNRGRRTNEMLVLMRRLWSEDHVTFEGRYYQYKDVTISPKPKQAELPAWVGGASAAALERAARYGTGWVASSTQTLAGIAESIATIKARTADLGRPFDAEHFGASIAYRFGAWDEPPVQRNLEGLVARLGSEDAARAQLAVGDAEDIARVIESYVAAGITKFVLRPIAVGDAEYLAQTERLAETVAPRFHAAAVA